MRIPNLIVLLASLSVASLSAAPAFAKCDAETWKFGMSKETVLAIDACGPYKSFSNGDLETYNGIYEGKPENFQFFFEDGKLHRIGIYLYEGGDAKAGVQRWLSLYQSLTRHYGGVETPGNAAPAIDDPAGAAFMAKALQQVESSGKMQMAPFTQSREAFVYASFVRSKAANDTMYFVVLYHDAPARLTAALDEPAHALLSP